MRIEHAQPSRDRDGRTRWTAVARPADGALVRLVAGGGDPLRIVVIRWGVAPRWN